MFRHCTALLILFITPLLAEEKPKEPLDFEISSYAMPEIATTFQALAADGEKARIVLSDGSVWLLRSVGSEQAQAEIAPAWYVGDDIRLARRTPNQVPGNFLLKNARTRNVYCVDLDKTYVDMSKASFIDKIDQNGYAIILNGGTQWAIGYLGSFTTWNWHRYQRIIVNKSAYYRTEDYMLINSEDGSTAWSSLILWR